MTLKDLLMEDEGLSLKPYLCPAKKLTIGFGRNLEDSGISKAEALYLLENDITRATALAGEFPWFESLSEARRAVVVSMIFNLGIQGFRGFRKMTTALGLGLHDVAAREMRQSLWASQVGKRAERLARMMETNEMQGF